MDFIWTLTHLNELATWFAVFVAALIVFLAFKELRYVFWKALLLSSTFALLLYVVRTVS